MGGTDGWVYPNNWDHKKGRMMDTNEPGREPTDAELLRDQSAARARVTEYAMDEIGVFNDVEYMTIQAVLGQALIASDVRGMEYLSGQRPMPDTPAPDEVAQLRAEVARLKGGLRSIVGLCDECNGMADAQAMAGRVLNEQLAGGLCEPCEWDTRKAENTALTARVAELEAVIGYIRAHVPALLLSGDLDAIIKRFTAPGKEPTSE